MNRRQVIKGIVVVSSGALIFPACNFLEEPMPVYDRLMIDKSEFNLIGDLAEAILPVKKHKIKTPEPTREFILTMINDCLKVEDCEKYVAGLKAFVLFVNEKYQKVFSKTDTATQQEIFKHFAVPVVKRGKTPPKIEDPVKFFVNTTREYAILHLKRSEYFMTNQLEWSFVPKKWDGNVKL